MIQYLILLGVFMSKNKIFILIAVCIIAYFVVEYIHADLMTLR